MAINKDFEELDKLFDDYIIPYKESQNAPQIIKNQNGTIDWKWAVPIDFNQDHERMKQRFAEIQEMELKKAERNKMKWYKKLWIKIKYPITWIRMYWRLITADKSTNQCLRVDSLDPFHAGMILNIKGTEWEIVWLDYINKSIIVKKHEK